MKHESDRISAVPANIITGSLGAGKTTLIQSLLEQKPHDERWAVLVNEFGEVGIDKALIRGAKSSSTESGGIFIKEVPGGCMCCTSGLPMQIALNLLLKESKPDRLLIEPTGLGHPTEVLATLCASHYRSVLNIQATFTLIDAVKLRSSRWALHPTFKEQVQIADVIVKTKTRDYTAKDEQNFEQYIRQLGVNNTPIIDGSDANMALTELSRKSTFLQKHPEHDIEQDHHDQQYGHQRERPLEINEESLVQPIVKVANHGQGFYSFGWICAPERLFDSEIASSVFKTLNVERLKAVLLTEDGASSFNLSANQLTVERSKYRNDSRLEFICDSQEDAELACKKIEQGLSLFEMPDCT